MKKKLLYLIGVMIAISLVAAILINSVTGSKKIEKKEDEDVVDLVASFYPMYIIGLNLLDGLDEFHVRSLTSGYIGCLHDYQLTTEDMKNISSADIFLMNGGGMESFMDTVVKNYPELYTMNTSDGIEFLSSDISEHDHEEDHDHIEGDDDHEEDHNHIEGDDNHGEDESNATSHDGHNHSEYNAHVWLDPAKYMLQIENAKLELIHYIEEHTDWGKEEKHTAILKIEENADQYILKVSKIEEQLIDLKNNNKDAIEEDNQQGVVVFHEAFVYIANRIGLNVARSIEIEQDTQLSPREIAEIIDEIKEDKISYLFTEKQYGDKIASQIQAETGVKIYQIDSAVTGESDKDAYLKAMEFNLNVLKEMLQ